MLSSPRSPGPALNSGLLRCDPDACFVPRPGSHTALLGFLLHTSPPGFTHPHLASPAFPPPGPGLGLLLLVLRAELAAMGSALGRAQGGGELSLWQTTPFSEMGGKRPNTGLARPSNIEVQRGVWDAEVCLVLILRVKCWGCGDRVPRAPNVRRAGSRRRAARFESNHRPNNQKDLSEKGQKLLFYLRSGLWARKRERLPRKSGASTEGVQPPCLRKGEGMPGLGLGRTLPRPRRAETGSWVVFLGLRCRMPSWPFCVFVAVISGHSACLRFPTRPTGR